MANIQNLLYRDEYKINDSIQIRIPKVGEILKHEDTYYNLVFLLTAMPIDMMVQLDDMEIDFASIDEYGLFLLMFQTIRQLDTSLIFGNLDLLNFQIDINSQNGDVTLLDVKNNIRIDREIHNQIAIALRKIHHLTKNNRKPANDEAKEFMISRARRKQRRLQNSKHDSQLESLIVAMVNTSEYKYNFEDSKELTIYQFNECVRQIIHKVDYDNIIRGVYAGTINAKDLNQDDLNWLVHK